MPHFFLLQYLLNGNLCFTVYAFAGYISTTINDGPGCLMLRCPDPSCLAAVGHDMVDKLASEEDKEKYNRYFLRSYIEDNRKVNTRSLENLYHTAGINVTDLLLRYHIVIT